MKRNHFMSAAVASALAVLSGHALAITPAATATPLTNPVGGVAGGTSVVIAAGSSAQDNAVLTAMRSLCQAGKLDVYSGGVSVQKNNFNAYYCVMGATAGALNGKNFLLVKSSNGGSGSGAADVASAIAHQNINLDVSGGPSCSAPLVNQGFADGTGLSTYTLHQNCATEGASTFGLLPNGGAPKLGLSDEEPAFFATKAQLTLLNPPAPTSAVVFGVPVTTALRDALQAAQNLVPGTNCGLTPPAGVAAREDVTCMPSLTRTQISGIFTQSLTDWSQFKNTAGTAPLALPAGGDSLVYIARRGDTSGTQVESKIYFTGEGCMANVAPFASTGALGAADTTGDCAAPTDTMYIASGSSNITACLNNLNKPATIGAQGLPGPFYALGVLTTETQEDVSPTGDGWRFIAIDGHAPTLLNVVSGRYDYFSEATAQCKSGVVGDVLTFCSVLPGVLRSATNIAALNIFSTHPWGAGGGLAIPSLTITPPAPPLAANFNSVNTLTKSPLAGVTNNCQKPVPFGSGQQVFAQ